MLTPVENASLADKVFEQLAREIVVGELRAGDAVPTERELTETFGVNRHVVREAIQRMEQVGLVKTSQGGRTRVLDFTRHAGMDLLGMLARYAGAAESARLWLSVLQMRAAIATDVARLCAELGDPAVGAELLELVERARNARDGRELLAIGIRFWDVAIDASGNLAYRLAYNSLLRSTSEQGDGAIAFARAEMSVSDYGSRIAKAIAAGDAELAVRETQAAARPALDVLASAVAAQSREAEKVAADSVA